MSDFVKGSEKTHSCPRILNQQQVLFNDSCAHARTHTHAHTHTHALLVCKHDSCLSPSPLTEHQSETQNKDESGSVQTKVLSALSELMKSQRKALLNHLTLDCLTERTGSIRQDKHTSTSGFCFGCSAGEVAKNATGVSNVWEQESALYLTVRRGFSVCLCGESEELNVFVCVCSYILLEDEAGQQGRGLFDRQIVEETVENHLRQQELVTTGNIPTQLMIKDFICQKGLTPLFHVVQERVRTDKS